MLHRPLRNLEPFIDRLALRSILSERERHQIRELPIAVRQVKAGHDFVGLGERVGHVSYIVEGLVGRFDQNSKGERQITAVHIGGDMADLHSVVQPTATSALQALSTSTILQISHPALRHASGTHPAVAEAFWRDCMVDSMILAQWVVNVGCRDARSRIAHFLCEMACRYKVVPANGKASFELSMTQAQLAEITGLTSVHVNRTLKSLNEMGTSFYRKIVRIENWDALVRIGDFDRGYLQDDLGQEERIRIVH
jgi:CRP-like cAMP-binding protein